ncbi:DEAD/DEAH box helicase [Lacticaseibacillus baoqingensis]|uniref:DEAD/DEAH box helicase n=1 Tax=Lacticaseibacillus baoqingensis TaxID=2486013 RepID=A0ABW4E5A8_9LACO
MAEPFQALWTAAGFTAQTLIQEAVYQPLKTDQNVIGLAPTGSGKTLAFGLPLLEKLVPGDGIQLLILSPSQELAIQTRNVLQPYAKAVNMRVTGVTGNANVKRQKEQLKQHPEVIVGTAGRLVELANAGTLKLHTLQTIIVDEADELLRDPGLDQVRALTMAAPADVQMGFFSATASPMFDQLDQWFGIDATRIDVRALDHTQGAVQHLFVQTDNAHRVEWLRSLAHLDHFQALVFFNNNGTLEKVAGILHHQAVKFAVLSRNDRSTTRANALAAFRKHKVTLLLVTDLAGRGLDLKKLPAVINYAAPKRAEAYIHRAGRTGRMGASGYVITLGDDHDRRDLKKLVPQYAIQRGYLVDGQLTTVAPKAEAAPAVPAASAAPAPAKTPTTSARPKPKAKAATAVAPDKPKHKKKRLRDQKNKGKRKPRG